MTLPYIHAYQRATQPEKDFLKLMIESEELDDAKLGDVIDIIKKYGGIRYATDKAVAHIEDAKRQLDIFDPDIDRMALLAVADFVIERTY